MKKGLFNKRYGLQNAVVEGWKTQTRRICKNQINPSIDEAKWKVGEIIAVAQSYEDAGLPRQMNNAKLEQLFQHAGWNNAMFVRADLMPHRIKITNVRVERLQDISVEDCICEGVKCWHSVKGYVVEGMYRSRAKHMLRVFTTARAAFATLIDKISGKGTWDSNPFVYAYEFELVK